MSEPELRIKCMLIHCQPTLADLLHHLLDKNISSRGDVRKKLPELIGTGNNRRYVKYKELKSKDYIDPREMTIPQICHFLMTKEFGLLNSEKCCNNENGRCSHECLTCRQGCRNTVECYKKHCRYCGKDAYSECNEQFFLRALSLINTLYEIATTNTIESSDQYNIFKQFEQGEPFRQLQNYKDWKRLWGGVQKTMAKILEYLTSKGKTDKEEWKDRDMEMRIVLKKKKEELIFLNKEKLRMFFGDGLERLGCLDHEEELRAAAEFSRRRSDESVVRLAHGSIANIHESFPEPSLSKELEKKKEIRNDPVSLLSSSSRGSQGSHESGSSRPGNVFMALERNVSEQSNASGENSTGQINTPSIYETVPSQLSQMESASRMNNEMYAIPRGLSGNASARAMSFEGNGNFFHSYIHGQLNGGRRDNGSLLAEPKETNEDDEPEVTSVSNLSNSMPMYSLQDFRKYEIGRKLVLIRGLPGSGRTTLATRIAGLNGKVLATDDYFYVKGQYNFEGAKLPEAHKWNQERAEDEMKNGTSPICIDNTNLQAWEMKEYVLLALKHNYDTVLKEVATPWANNPKECAKRTSFKEIKENMIKGMLNKYHRNLTVNDILNSDPPRKKKL